jgi:nucleotide-binding universal stress UspA family protein
MIPKIIKILYSTDLSKNSAYAFRYALNSAKQHNAELVIIHVMEVMDTTTRNLLMAYVEKEYFTEKEEEKIAYAKNRIEKRLKVFFDKARIEYPELADTNISIEICEGYPAEEILRKADELNCDAIVMGTHGKGLLSQTFLGSVTKKVLRRTRKPVFIIPLPKEESDLTVHDI